MTADDILGIGRACSKEESPIDLSFQIMNEVKLPTLEWGNFDIIPKLMKISNTGMTAVLSGKWQGPRPFLSKGPISGRYVFSQLHFHWGRTVHEGSEHRINGQALPLEAHVMFFKNVYENQDDAMKKNDGTLTIAYFFKLQDEDNMNLEPIISSLPFITQPFSSHQTDNIPLKVLAPVFANDYYMYWGNVYRMNVLWIISRQPIGISKNQLLLFRNLLDANNRPIEKNYRDPRDLNDRVVYYINPSDNRSDILLPLQLSSSIGNVEDPFDKIPDTFQKVLKTLSNSIPEKSTGKSGDSLLKKKSILDILSFNLSKSPNIADLKYTLAKTLLDIEKKESNDYGVLENYIKAKYARKQFLVEDQERKQISHDDQTVTNDIDYSIQDDESNTVLDKLKYMNEETKQNKMNIIDDIYTYPQENEVFAEVPTFHQNDSEDNSFKKTDGENVCNSLNNDSNSKISEEGTLENKENIFENDNKNILVKGDNVYSNFSNESGLNMPKGENRKEVITPEMNISFETEQKPVIKRKSDVQISQQMSHQKNVTFAQLPPEVINEKEMDFEMNKQSGVGSWLGEDKLLLMKKKLAKRMTKIRMDYQQEEKMKQSEKTPPIKAAAKHEMGSGEKQEQMVNESAQGSWSARRRVKQIQAKVNKAREENELLKNSERGVWKP